MEGSESTFNPLISVITVVFNNKQSIEKTILSVLNQSYKAIDYVLIDGGSTDGTLDIINQYKDRIAYFVSEKDKGIYDAMNKGLKAAKGEYVLFLNSGDLLTDNSVLNRVIAAAPDADCYYGETNLMDEVGKVRGTRTDLTTRKLPKKMTWNDMINGMIVSHQSVIFRKSLVPFYNLEYKCSADIDWVIQSLKNCVTIVNTNLIISNYLIGGFSIKNQKRCWKERFKIYVNYYGWGRTLWAHLLIIIKNIFFKISGKRNF